MAQNFKTNGTYHYCYKLKRKQKSYKIYKYIKNLKHFKRNLVVTAAIKPRHKNLTLNLL